MVSIWNLRSKLIHAHFLTYVTSIINLTVNWFSICNLVISVDQLSLRTNDIVFQRIQFLLWVCGSLAQHWTENRRGLSTVTFSLILHVNFHFEVLYQWLFFKKAIDLTFGFVPSREQYISTMSSISTLEASSWIINSFCSCSLGRIFDHIWLNAWCRIICHII